MDFTPAPTDLRFTQALYTVKETASYLGMPESTFRRWVRGNGKPGLINTLPGAGPRQPSIPFVGLAKGVVIAAFRRVEHLKMDYIRDLLDVLDAELGVEEALASNRLYSHGGQVLFDHAKELGGERQLAEVLTKNTVFTPVVEGGLKLITYGSDMYAKRVKLPATFDPIVEADPFRGSGKPVTVREGVRVVDIIDRFRGRESPAFIAEDFGVPEEDVLDILRAFYSAFEESA